MGPRVRALAVTDCRECGFVHESVDLEGIRVCTLRWGRRQPDLKPIGGTGPAGLDRCEQ